LKTDELSYVALKVAGIYCLVTGIGLIRGAVAFASFSRNEIAFPYLIVLANFIPCLLLILLAIVLLWGTKWAGRMLCLSVDLEDEEELKIKGFLSVAFAVVGIILLVDGLSRAVRVPGQISAYLGSIDPVNGNRLPFYLSEPLFRVFDVILKIGLGLYLFIGADGLVRFWHRYRDKKVIID
jgi:hypothetical protein